MGKFSGGSGPIVHISSKSRRPTPGVYNSGGGVVFCRDQHEADQVMGETVDKLGSEQEARNEEHLDDFRKRAREQGHEVS